MGYSSRGYNSLILTIDPNFQRDIQVSFREVDLFFIANLGNL